MNGSGTGFTRTFFCERDHQPQNNFKWPFQPPPTSSMIKKWKSALRNTFGLKAGVTTHKLGAWTNNDTSQWIWFHHHTSSSLFQRFGHLWKVWRRESRRGRIGLSTKYKYFTTANRLPTSALKATIIYHSPNRIRFTGSAPMMNDTTILHSNSLTSTMIPLSINDEGGNFSHLFNCLQDGTVNIVSDCYS